jgi:hypothetical protein
MKKSNSAEFPIFAGLTEPIFGTAAFALRLLPDKFKRVKKQLCERRFLRALERQDFPQAEKIVTTFATFQHPPLEVLTKYIRQVLESGHAVNPEALANAPALHPECRPLVRASMLQLEGKPDEALASLQSSATSYEIRYLIMMARQAIHQQSRNHRALAEEGLAFLDAEQERILIRLAVKVAISAEAAGREDILSRALGRIISDRDRVREDPELLRRFWKEAEIGSMTVYDSDAALEILLEAKSLKIPNVKDPLIDLLCMREQVRPLAPVIEAARKDFLRRAKLLHEPEQPGEVTVILPASGFRANEIGYKGFRADIRFVTQCIVETLQEIGVRFTVKGQMGTHSEIDLPTPSFGYHTISNRSLGLHFKETDRPSRFSFDCRGYSGWSDFSGRSIADLDLTRIDPAEAAAFFEREKKSIIAGNISKYEQADLLYEEPLPPSYVFVGLQKIGDAVQGLAHATPFEMLDEVMSTCGKHGLEVVVKRHPQCKSPQVGEYLKTHAAAGRITVAAGSIHNIIEKAQAVCVVNSGVGAEALLHEKPVYVFGRSEYMAACFVCETPGDFAAQFVPGKLPVTKVELRRFWWLLRNEYAVDLRNRATARKWIARRVRQHLQEASPDAVGHAPPLADIA